MARGEKTVGGGEETRARYKRSKIPIPTPPPAPPTPPATFSPALLLRPGEKQQQQQQDGPVGIRVWVPDLEPRLRFRRQDPGIHQGLQANLESCLH